MNNQQEVFAMHTFNPTAVGTTSTHIQSHALIQSYLSTNLTAPQGTAAYLHSIYTVSALLSYLYDNDGHSLHKDFPLELTDLTNSHAGLMNALPHSAALPRSFASKVYHNYIEAMKAKPKSFLSANQRYPQSLVQLTLHHIILKR